MTLILAGLSDCYRPLWFMRNQTLNAKHEVRGWLPYTLRSSALHHGGADFYFKFGSGVERKGSSRSFQGETCPWANNFQYRRCTCFVGWSIVETGNRGVYFVCSCLTRFNRRQSVCQLWRKTTSNKNTKCFTSGSAKNEHWKKVGLYPSLYHGLFVWLSVNPFLLDIFSQVQPTVV